MQILTYSLFNKLIYLCQEDSLLERQEIHDMKRRQAIRQLMVVAGGIAALPDWARGWSAGQLPVLETPFPDQALLSAIIGAILPESDIPGAVSLGVPDFVALMLNDCYTKEDSDKVKTGMHYADNLARREYQKPFIALDSARQQAILLSFEQGSDDAVKEFYQMVKNLTIQGYTSTEYVQTNFLEYEMAPGYFHGCVPVKQ